MNTRAEVTMFDENGDFTSWSRKMKALLLHNKVHYALKQDMKEWPEEAKKKIIEIREEA